MASSEDNMSVLGLSTSLSQSRLANHEYLHAKHSTFPSEVASLPRSPSFPTPQESEKWSHRLSLERANDNYLRYIKHQSSLLPLHLPLRNSCLSSNKSSTLSSGLFSLWHFWLALSFLLAGLVSLGVAVYVLATSKMGIYEGDSEDSDDDGDGVVGKLAWRLVWVVGSGVLCLGGLGWMVWVCLRCIRSQRTLRQATCGVRSHPTVSHRSAVPSVRDLHVDLESQSQNEHQHYEHHSHVHQYSNASSVGISLFQAGAGIVQQPRYMISDESFVITRQRSTGSTRNFSKPFLREMKIENYGHDVDTGVGLDSDREREVKMGVGRMMSTPLSISSLSDWMRSRSLGRAELGESSNGSRCGGSSSGGPYSVNSGDRIGVIEGEDSQTGNGNGTKTSLGVANTSTLEVLRREDNEAISNMASRARTRPNGSPHPKSTLRPKPNRATTIPRPTSKASTRTALRSKNRVGKIPGIQRDFSMQRPTPRTKRIPVSLTKKEKEAIAKAFTYDKSVNKNRYSNERYGRSPSWTKLYGGARGGGEGGEKGKGKGEGKLKWDRMGNGGFFREEWDVESFSGMGMVGAVFR